MLKNSPPNPIYQPIPNFPFCDFKLIVHIYLLSLEFNWDKDPYFHQMKPNNVSKSEKISSEFVEFEIGSWIS